MTQEQSVTEYFNQQIEALKKEVARLTEDRSSLERASAVDYSIQ